MYRFTIASGAPPADTTQYEGDQKCSPHNARVTSGQWRSRTRMEVVDHMPAGAKVGSCHALEST